MKRIFMVLAAIAGIACLSLKAQDTKQLSDYTSVKFYGIDFALAQVVGAEETPGDFISAFREIDRLMLSEEEKYVTPLAKRLKMAIKSVDIEPTLKRVEDIDETDLIQNKTPETLTEQDIEFELQELELPEYDGLCLVVMAGEINKGTKMGTFYYVFFEGPEREIVSCMPFKGQAGGFGLRNYWASSFYRTIAEINPTKFYNSKKKIKEGVTEGFQAVKEKVTGKGEEEGK